MSRQEQGTVIPATEWLTAMLPLLESGHELKIHPSGTSMVPFLRGDRDQAILTSVTGKRLKRGDVVLYVRKNGIHILHRIHHVKDGAYFMLGDSHTWIEGPVEKEAILAVASSLIRKGRVIQGDSPFYRFLARVWLRLRPLRPAIFFIRFRFFKLLPRG